MVAKSMRLALIVTLDICFHKKAGVKLINTYPETHSVDSAFLQIINSLFKIIYIQQQQKWSLNLPTFFFFITINQPTYSLFWLNPTLAARLKHRLLWNCEIWDWDNENEGDHELQEQQQVDWKFFYGGRWNAVAVEDGTMLRLD